MFSSVTTIVVTGAVVALVAGLLHSGNHGVDGIYHCTTSMKGKTVLITGGTTGLGLETARRLAQAGANIVITARSHEKGRRAVAAVEAAMVSSSSSPSSVSYKILHLDDLESTQNATHWDDIPTPIDVLILNAGIMAPPRLLVTDANVEKQFHTNHLGHYILTAALLPKLAKQNARVLVVSSEAHKIPGHLFMGGVDWDYAWEPTEKTYNAFKSYGLSKLANIYFASELNDMAPESYNFKAVSLHPGAVATELGRHLSDIRLVQNFLDQALLPFGKAVGLLLSVEQGANTPVYLATTDDAIVGGGYYNNMQHQRLASFATDPVVSRKLWEQTRDRAGINLEF